MHARDVGARSRARQALRAGVMLLWLPLLACASSPRARALRALDEGDYERAALEYRSALVADPSDAATWLQLGRVQLAAGHALQAREAGTRAALLTPHDARARVLVGESYELERNYAEAELAYRQAVQSAPREAYAWRVLGVRLLRWGRAQDAVQPLSLALRYDPSHAESYNALALAYVQLHDLAAAEATFRAGLEHAPTHVGLRLGLAGLLVNAGRLAEALRCYDEVASLRPRFAPVHVGRALVLDALGRSDEAQAAFDRAIAVAEDPRPYRQRANDYRALLAQRAAHPRRVATP